MDALLRKFHAAVETGDHERVKDVLASSLPQESAIPAHLDDPGKSC